MPVVAIRDGRATVLPELYPSTPFMSTCSSRQRVKPYLRVTSRRSQPAGFKGHIYFHSFSSWTRMDPEINGVYIGWCGRIFESQPSPPGRWWWFFLCGGFPHHRPVKRGGRCQQKRGPHGSSREATNYGLTGSRIGYGEPCRTSGEQTTGLWKKSGYQG